MLVERPGRAASAVAAAAGGKRVVVAMGRARRHPGRDESRRAELTLTPRPERDVVKPRIFSAVRAGEKAVQP